MVNRPLIDPNAPRFFLDSSVILSGAASDKGAAHVLLVLAEAGLIRLVVNPYVLNEVERHIQNKLKRAALSYTEVKTSIAWEVVPNPTETELEDWDAFIIRKDAPVLASAVSAKPASLVTLDGRDFIKNRGLIATKTELKILAPGQVTQSIREAIAAAFAPRQNGL